MRLDAHHRWRRVGRRRRRRNIPTIKRHIGQVVILAPVAEDEIEDSLQEVPVLLQHARHLNKIREEGHAGVDEDLKGQPKREQVE